MYLKNLLTITGRSPEKTSDLFVDFLTLKNKNEDFASKGSRCSVAAFLLLCIVLTAAGCDSPAPVGSDLDPDKEDITTQTFGSGSISTINANSYTGHLVYSSIGYVEDPAYGTLKAAALLKPSISKSEADSIGDDDELILKLVFEDVIYGDEAATSTFEIFEVDGPWRGNELKFGDEVAIDFSSKVAEFDVSDQDTIEVTLGSEWTQKYLEFYNASADRDSLYKHNFRGIAIVSSESNSKLHYLSHELDIEENSNPNQPPVTIPGTAVSMLVSRSEPSDDDEDEDLILSMRDWGTTITRTNEPAYTENYVLHAPETVLKVDLDFPKDELESNTIVNAQLIFGVDPSPAENYPSVVRPEVTTMRGFALPEEPSDLRDELFLNNARLPGTYDEDLNIFTVDITDYILNDIFGDNEPRDIYISLPEDGLMYSTQLFDENGPENMQPRLVITSVKSDS